MAAAKKFTVVKFTEVSEPGRNPYKVVPTFWIKNGNEDYVKVPYPPEDQLSQEFYRIFDCRPALAEWEDNPAVIEREADTYQAGVLYIKRQSSTPIDEETLLLWKQISCECMEKLSDLHPITMMYRLWSRVWNLIFK